MIFRTAAHAVQIVALAAVALLALALAGVAALLWRWSR